MGKNNKTVTIFQEELTGPFQKRQQNETITVHGTFARSGQKTDGNVQPEQGKKGGSK